MSPNAIHNEVISRMARQLSLDNYAEALSAILSRQEKTRNILVETPNLHWFLLKHKKALDVNGSIPIKNDKIFFIDSKLINGIRNEEADLGGYEHKHIIKFFSDNNITVKQYDDIQIPSPEQNIRAFMPNFLSILSKIIVDTKYIYSNYYDLYFSIDFLKAGVNDKNLHYDLFYFVYSKEDKKVIYYGRTLNLMKLTLSIAEAKSSINLETNPLSKNFSLGRFLSREEALFNLFNVLSRANHLVKQNELVEACRTLMVIPAIGGYLDHIDGRKNVDWYTGWADKYLFATNSHSPLFLNSKALYKFRCGMYHDGNYIPNSLTTYFLENKIVFQPITDFTKINIKPINNNPNIKELFQNPVLAKDLTALEQTYGKPLTYGFVLLEDLLTTLHYPSKDETQITTDLIMRINIDNNKCLYFRTLNISKIIKMLMIAGAKCLSRNDYEAFGVTRIVDGKPQDLLSLKDIDINYNTETLIDNIGLNLPHSLYIKGGALTNEDKS